MWHLIHNLGLGNLSYPDAFVIESRDLRYLHDFLYYAWATLPNKKTRWLTSKSSRYCSTVLKMNGVIKKINIMLMFTCTIHNGARPSAYIGRYEVTRVSIDGTFMANDFTIDLMNSQSWFKYPVWIHKIGCWFGTPVDIWLYINFYDQNHSEPRVDYIKANQNIINLLLNWNLVKPINPNALYLNSMECWVLVMVYSIWKLHITNTTVHLRTSVEMTWAGYW